MAHEAFHQMIFENRQLHYSETMVMRYGLLNRGQASSVDRTVRS
jgi:hypothetical protein